MMEKVPDCLSWYSLGVMFSGLLQADDETVPAKISAVNLTLP